jgi:hypothetical protein
LGPGQAVTVLEELTASEVKAFEEAMREVQSFRRDDQLFDIFKWNVEAVFAFCDQTVEAFKTDKAMSGRRMHEIGTQANRHLLNVLTSLRTFLDHTETRLKRTYGKASAEVETFKRATSREYDRRFAYRFLYRLRNYAQHCGLPVGKFSLGSEAMGTVGPGPDPPTRESLAIFFARDHLLTDFDDWGAKVGEELRDGPPRIEVTRLLRILNRSVTTIQSLLHKMTAQRARPHARRLRAFIERVRRQHPASRASVGGFIGEVTPSRLRIRFRHIPTDLMAELLPNDRYLKAMDGQRA